MAQGKVIIIGGTPRAGKTTLAVQLAHRGFNKISFDQLSDSLQKGFPEIVVEDQYDQEICAKKKYAFFESIVESAINDAKIYGLETVIDMYDFTPEYVSKLPFQKDIEVYFLAYPGLSIDQIRHNIRFYAEPSDWIAEVDDDYLKIVAQRCFDVNRKLVEQCRKYGYELVNTGAGDERTKALGDLTNRIINGGQVNGLGIDFECDMV
jgi:2-phosphoglycerate kinase